MTGTWALIASGNDAAMVMATKGDKLGALAQIDNVRDAAMRDVSDPKVQNECECRRLETRLSVAGICGDWALFTDALTEISKSGRFDRERLHFMVGVAAGLIRSMKRLET